MDGYGNGEYRSENLLEREKFLSATGKINIPIGRDSNGQDIVIDLNDIPSILLCGYTGTGKTAFIRTMLSVICMKQSPADVKFMVYDSKGVDYNVFSFVPHLLVPVAKDRSMAITMIKWAVAESQRRLSLLAEHSCRSIDIYNMKVSEAMKMPILVMVFDDFADLGLDTNEMNEFMSILRTGRVSGIHVIVATSILLSINSLHELLSNIQFRIAFKVASNSDSRRIFGEGGAELLHSPGELAYKNRGQVITGWSAYATFENIKMAMLTVSQKSSIYELGQIASQIFDDSKQNKADDNKNENLDEYFADAGRFVIEKGKASSSMLQRVFKIGYNRSAKLVDELERKGVISPEEDASPRRVLMTKEMFETLLAGGQGRKTLLNKGKVEETKAEPLVILRDFTEFSVGKEIMYIRNNRVFVKETAKSNITTSFGGRDIKGLLYKRPALFSKGYVMIELASGIDIRSSTPVSFENTENNDSNRIRVDFESGRDGIVRIFLKQLSEDIDVQIEEI